MGVIKQGILGGFSGSVANVVGSSWKGIAVIKSKPLSVANPRTTLQVGNRVKFKAGSELASSLLVSIVKPLWDRDAQQMSGYNAWVQKNHDYYNTLGEPQYGTLVISKGTNTKQDITGLTVGGGGYELTVKWDATVLEGQQLASDKAYVVVTREDDGEIVSFPGSTDRGSNQATVVFDAVSSPSTVWHAYLAFQSADGFRLFDQDYMMNSSF